MPDDPVDDATTTAGQADAIVRGSGNVFADLGFDDPEEELLKANLVLSITEQIGRLAVSQTEAARLLGLSQPDISRLLRGRTGGYSLERLFGFIRILGRDVEINVVAPDVPRPGRMRLRVPESA